MSKSNTCPRCLKNKKYPKLNYCNECAIIITREDMIMIKFDKDWPITPVYLKTYA